LVASFGGLASFAFAFSTSSFFSSSMLLDPRILLLDPRILLLDPRILLLDPRIPLSESFFEF